MKPLFAPKEASGSSEEETSPVDAKMKDDEENPFMASAYIKQYTTSVLGVLFIVLGHDADPTRASPGPVLLARLSLVLAAVWYLDVAQTLIVTCYV